MRNISLFLIKERRNSEEIDQNPNRVRSRSLQNLMGKKRIKPEIRTKKAPFQGLLPAPTREKSLEKTKKFENNCYN